MLGLLAGAPAAAATLPLSALGEGDLVLSEVLINPMAVTDVKGEWFEIYNNSGSDVDLDGLVLTDSGTDTYTVASSVKVLAGDYALLAVNKNSAVNGGLPTVDLTYTRATFKLDDGADEIQISYAGLVFDSLAWGAVTDFASTEGVALQLDPAHLNIDDNDRAYYWCEAEDPYGLGDLGTPGSANADCGLSSYGVDDLSRGDLVITEVMVDPTKATDAVGEWFEVYNDSGVELTLYGLKLTDGGTDSYTVVTDELIAPDSYALLAVNSTTAYNGGLPEVDILYKRSLFRFDNGTDEIYIANSTTQLDEVIWNTTTQKATAGATRSLDPGSMDPDANDSAAAWCDATVAYGSGDLGSPAAANEVCPVDADGDGATADVDCDDADPDVYPGADELCNSIDDDCDGDVDTGAVDAPTWYLDYDLDGVGATRITVTACDNPDDTFYVTSSDDCDDLDPNAYPGSTELCDGADNDCDGTVDNGISDGGPWYADADADGYGDAATTSSECEMPSGSVANDDDCDDTNAAVSPDADETCNAVDDDCDGTVDDNPTDGSSWYLDYDQDGFGGSVVSVSACENPNTAWYADNADDCDDVSASNYPGAPEVCDDVDNDCNSTVDDGAVSDTTWYADADADGYGDAATTSTECDLPSGYAANALDCDDTNVAVFPGADELCNTADDDCDGTVDEDDATDAATWYLDYDDDGYGADKITALACSAPTYFVASNDDCNDLRDDMNPGETEACGDFTDNNCDDSALDCSVTGTVDLSAANAKFTGDTSYTDASRGLAGIGDVNGDGYADIAVGAPSTTLDTAATSTGAAYVVLGSDSLTGTVALSTGAVATFTGEVGGDQAGYSVSPAGDQNDDGYADLLIGARDEGTGGTGAGAVYLEYGPLTGSESLSAADAKFTGVGATNVLGFNIDTREPVADSLGVLGGDINNDGVADLVMGAYGNSDVLFEAGATYIVYGPAPTGTTSMSDADATLLGEAVSDRAGRWASGGDDTDGDGFADVIVGAYAADPSGRTDAGRAYLVLGPPASGSTSLTDADAIFDGAVAGEESGFFVDNGGDIDGDGNGDILISAVFDATVGTKNGAVYVVYGPVTGTMDLSLADAKLIGAVAKDQFGVSAKVVADANGDERAEVLVGADGEDAGGSAAGAAYMFYGPVSGTLSSTASDAKFVGELKGDAAGIRVASAGDVDLDGYGDWLVGTVDEDTGGTSAGAAYLLLGSGW